MGFADPQSFNPGTGAVSLPRVGASTPTGGAFASADGQLKLTIDHSTQGPRFRHVAKINLAKIVSNELVPDQNVNVAASAHIVVDLPRSGLTRAEVSKLAAGLSAWATEANLLKVINGES